MGKDLREIFEKDRKVSERSHTLKQAHKARFLELLEKEIPEKKKADFSWLKIAASVAVLLGAALFYLNQDTTDAPLANPVVEQNKEEKTTISFGDLSPDLKKIENYYVANINLTLAELNVSQESKDMTDGFMKQLDKLNTEYNRLNMELNTQGPNDQTISALIKNLQLRLQLLQKLKSKLNQLKLSKNEQV